MILDEYLLTDLVLNLKLYDHIIEPNNGPLKGSTAPMADLGTYELKNYLQGRYHWNIHLQMIMHNEYVNQEKSALILNNYVYFAKNQCQHLT